MSRVAAWLQASRPLAQLNLALPLLLGQALAYSIGGGFSWTAFAVVHAFGVIDQLFIVFANDYADVETDRENRTYSPYSGGSRVVPQGKLTPQSLRRAAGVMAVLLVGGCVWAAWSLNRPLLLGAGVLALGLMWLYSFPPVRLSYRGHGEVLQGVGLGVVLPLLGFYVQAGSLDAFPFGALLPFFVLGVVGNISTSLPDFPSDRASGKRSYPVRVGQYTARRHTLELLALAALFTPLVLAGSDWPWLLVVALSPFSLLAANLPLLGSADAENGAECRRFVTVNALALNLLLTAWVSTTLLSAPR